MRWGQARWSLGGARLPNATTALPVLAAILAACSRTPAPAPTRIPAPVPAPAPTPPLLPAPKPSEGTIAGGAGSLAYRIVGSGPDTVLVPLGAWLDPALASLGDERRAMVFYDPRHRGRSHALGDTAAGTFDGDVEDLEAVRRDLGISRVAAIGYDYYAGVVAAWAARYPGAVSRVVLLSPIEPSDSLARDWTPPDRIARLDTAAARQLVKDRAAGRDTSGAQAYCEAFWRVNGPVFVGDPAAAAAFRPAWCALPNESPPRLAAAAALALASLGPAHDVGARAMGITAPVLVIHGGRDLVANPQGAREWARRIPGARLLLLGNVGHLPHVEDAPVVLASIAEFLGGRWPPRAGPP